MATCADIKSAPWSIKDLTKASVGMWEPSYDQVLWEKKKEIHLLVQRVGQGEGERLENISPQMVSILEWAP